MDYTKELINQDILELAKKIADDVPYWMHQRAIDALKTSLRRCLELEESGSVTKVLRENKTIIQNCIRQFKVLTT